MIMCLILILLPQEVEEALNLIQSKKYPGLDGIRD